MSSKSPLRAWAEIDLAALAHNITTLKSLYAEGGADLMAVVKADAYGHDINIVAPRAYEYGLRHFGVATTEEGMLVRRLLPGDAGVYVLSPVLQSDAARIVDYRLTSVIGDREMATAISKEAARWGTTAAVHLDVDTGMGRSGATLTEARAVFDAVRSLPSIRLTGIMTHFACADENADDTRGQHKLLTDFLESLGTAADGLTVHAGNSPATLVLGSLVYHTLVRPGLLLYGIAPVAGMLEQPGVDVRPVMALKASVTLCRDLRPGDSISYGKTYRVPPSGGRYATIGIGYGDGYPRRLANCGSVLVHGRRAPICGRICMDQFVVDVSQIPNVETGDVAMLIGRDGNETITINEIADMIATTPHEISTCLTPRTPRIAVDPAGVG